MARRLLILLTTALAVGCSTRTCGSSTSTAGSATDPAIQNAARNGPGLLPLVEKSLPLPVPRTFDLSHVDPVHFAAALGKDPNRIFEFVRNHIAFEPYEGVLRGPKGTLLAMAGNSPDRAMLLATLLRLSGYEVRYVRGTLPEARARELVASLWAERPPAPMGSQATTAGSASNGDWITAAIQRDGTLLRDRLKSAGIPRATTTPVTMESLVKESRNHYWVELSKDDAWAPVDPSFATSTPGQVYAESEETMAELPESLFHRIEIRVRIEEYAGDKVSSRDVLRYSAKAHDLSGSDLIVVHQPVDQKKEGTHHVKPELIVHRSAVAGDDFWLKPPRAETKTAILDAFGGGGDDEATLATAESIEMDFIAPDGSKQTVVRDLFDRIGLHQRHSGTATATGQIISTINGANTDDFVAAVYDIFVTTGAIDSGHLTALGTTSTPKDDDPIDVGAGLRRINIAFAALSDVLTNRIAGPTGLVGRVYLDTPRVQISEFAGTARTLRLSLDLRRDPGRAAILGDRPEHLFFVQVVRGVVNGALERSVIQHFARGGNGDAWPGSGLSTSLVFERVHASNAQVVVLTGDASALDASVPQDSRARIVRALAEGKVVIAPRAPIEIGGRLRFAWWQIDPQSGLNTPITDEGLHQAQVELSIVRVDNQFAVVHYLPNARHVVVPRAGRYFASEAAAEMYCEGLVQTLGNSGIRATWGWIIF